MYSVLDVYRHYYIYRLVSYRVTQICLMFVIYEQPVSIEGLGSSLTESTFEDFQIRKGLFLLPCSNINVQQYSLAVI